MVASFRFESLSLLLNSPLSLLLLYPFLRSCSLFPLPPSIPPPSVFRRRDASIPLLLSTQPHPTKLKARLFRVPLLIPLSLLLLPVPPLGPRAVFLDLFLSCFSWFNSFLLSRRECLNSLRPLFTPCLSPPLFSSLLFSSLLVLHPRALPPSKPRKVDVELSLSLSFSLFLGLTSVFIKAVKFDS